MHTHKDKPFGNSSCRVCKTNSTLSILGGYGACMTRTPPEDTGGDLKAHAQVRQDAKVVSICRSVWPDVPVILVLCHAHTEMPTTRCEGQHGNSSSAPLRGSEWEEERGRRGWPRRLISLKLPRIDFTRFPM